MADAHRKPMLSYQGLLSPSGQQALWGEGRASFFRDLHEQREKGAKHVSAKRLGGDGRRRVERVGVGEVTVVPTGQEIWVNEDNKSKDDLLEDLRAPCNISVLTYENVELVYSPAM
jgi:hypothetical protein